MKKDIRLQLFGRLQAIYPTEERIHGNVVWECRCSCGTYVRTTASRLITGHTQSCGCQRKDSVGDFNKETKSIYVDGYLTREHPLYPTYHGIKNRCYWKKHEYFKYYGGRGIRMCDRWLNSFVHFVEDMGERPEGCTIDREDPDGDYTPDNCRWATAEVQRHNRSTTLSEVSL